MIVYTKPFSELYSRKNGKACQCSWKKVSERHILNLDFVSAGGLKPRKKKSWSNKRVTVNQVQLMLTFKMQGNDSFTCHRKERGKRKNIPSTQEKSGEKSPHCQGLFYLDVFGEAAVLCVFMSLSVFDSYEWIYKPMFIRTSASNNVWRIPFLTWSPGTFSYQETTFSISVNWLFPFIDFVYYCVSRKD